MAADEDWEADHCAERAMWQDYMDAYLEWKRDPVPPEQYRAVALMGGFNPNPPPGISTGFNPNDPSGGHDEDGASWGVHPYMSDPRPAWVNWALTRALFWPRFRAVSFWITQVGINQGHLGGPVGSRYQQEAEEDGVVGDA